MHLVGFIIRIYHDARSPDRQIHPMVYLVKLGQFVPNWATVMNFTTNYLHDVFVLSIIIIHNSYTLVRFVYIRLSHGRSMSLHT